MKKSNSKQAIAESTWLNYFNQILYEQGIITESQRNKLSLKIDNRPPSAKHDRNTQKASS